MKKVEASFEFSATDLVGYLNCHHLTALDRAVAEGVLPKPKVWDPLLQILWERGAAHEQSYVEHLMKAGLDVVSIDGVEVTNAAVADTLAAMQRGVPELHPDLTTPSVLAMSYVEGRPVDDLATAPRVERNRVMTLLIGLLFRELFEFRLMQTDPNFANYRHAPATGQVILLDFGTTRAFPDDFADLYRRLLRAGLTGDRPGIRAAALQIGFLAGDTPARLEKAMLEMFEMSLEPLRQDVPFDFGASDLAMRMREAGMAMAEDREYFRIPPMDTLFPQRKFGGMYLLATRMRARVDLRALVEPHL